MTQLPGQVSRTQAKIEARAKMLWGDSPQAVLVYLASQGFDHDEAAALAEELSRLTRTNGEQSPSFRCEIDAAAANRWTPEEARHLLFIAREAVSNSRRHSHGHAGLLALEVRDTGIALRIEDDGIGFDADAVAVATGDGDGRPPDSAPLCSSPHAVRARARPRMARRTTLMKRRVGHRVPACRRSPACQVSGWTS